MASSENRQAKILGDLAGESLTLERMTARERVSEPFSITLDVISPLAEIDFMPHLGKPSAIEVNDESGVIRHFHGLLFEASGTADNLTGFHYRLILRPWLYLLSHSRNYAIFQEKNSLDILRKIFEGYGFSDFDFEAVSERPPARPYCVQYDESDFDFVSRLMEEDGLFYSFTHKEDRHVLVVRDKPKQNADAGLEEIGYWPTGQIGAAPRLVITSFEETSRSGGHNRVVLRGFDFTRADAPRQTVHEGAVVHGLDKVTTLVYPEHHDVAERTPAARGERLLLGQRAERRMFRGETNVGTLACGGSFGLAGHAVERLDGVYMVTALTYTVDSQAVRSGEASGGGTGSVLFEAAPADTPWKPLLKTPRQTARGPETAVVTGPADQVLHTDEHGRVKVRFHWDRDDGPNENSTCWIRVSHNSAGAGFGSVILPRIGQEVIVDFLSGDPDQPIVTGRVYNSVNPHPYALPANSTRSVWKSQTVGEKGDYSEAETPPGSEKGFNEIMFEDKGGEEQISVHAQRNMNSWVRLDDDHKVGRDQKERVGRDRTVSIKKNLTTTLDEGDEKRTLTKGKRVTTIKANDELTIQSGNKKLTVSTGDYSVNVSVGKITMQAGTSIELKVGANSVKIDQTGVTIKGTMVKIEGTAMLNAKAPMTQIDGSGMVMVKGGVIMLN